MKRVFLCFVTAILLFSSCGNNAERDAARDVIERTVGHKCDNISLKIVPPGPDGASRYATEVRRGVLRIEGSSSVALCRGFYDYLTSNGYGTVTWTGKRIELPAVLPDAPRKEVVSPFSNHLYYNVCTYGYTTPFWDWDKWEREIDWMALHGFDMPLAPVAGEAILARVWRGLGLTDEEIGEYFTGPAHMPWMRMGNMTELDGAPSLEWHEGQIELQHKINDRMLELGMKPVYQGFAGFVPRAMGEHFPDVDLKETKWSGFRSWMLSPLDDLFSKIGTAYIKEWEKEFGKGKYYLIDSFNELEIPFGEKGSQERFDGLRNYGEVLYKSLSDANPDAVWVMQGWMFGYHRNYWDKESVAALLSGAPEGKLMVIDLAVDFNEFVWRSEKSWNYLDGFHGKEWIFSTVPNFGGRSALTGALDFYANGHLEALNSPNKGLLTGYGTSPEGVEQNDVIYEIISAAGWSRDSIDVAAYLHDYSAARYGSCPEAVDRFWREMRQSAYNTFTNHGRFKWQMRPFLQRKQMMGINEHYFTAIESFLSCAEEMKGSELYKADAVMYAAMYLSGKAENLLDAVNWAYIKGDKKAAAGYEERFLKILADADRLLESHPILRLERWIELARAAAKNPAEADTFEQEARRLISVWGGPVLQDYSCRVWAGFIRDFYIPRWQQYFEVKKNPVPFDFAEHDMLWVGKKGISEMTPFDDPVANAAKLVAEYGDVTPSIIAAPDNAIGFWSPYEFSNKDPRIHTTIDREWMPYIKGIRISNVRGTDPVTVSRVSFRARSVDCGDQRTDIVVRPGQTVVIPVDITVQELLPAEITVYVYLKGKENANSYAAIELDFGREKPDGRKVSFK